MLKAVTGSSVVTDERLAVREAMGKILEKNLPLKLLFVYTCSAFDHKVLLKSIAEAAPGVEVVGGTSFEGVITQEGMAMGDDGFIGIMGLSDDSLTTGVACVEKGLDAQIAGVEVAKRALVSAGKKTAPDYFYMSATPGDEELYLKGITEVIGRVPFFGGSAADRKICGEWQVFAGCESVSEGVAVAFFYSEKKMTNVFTGAYRETDKCGIITKAKSRRELCEINGEKALVTYARWMQKDVAELLKGQLLIETILHPIGVKDRLGDLVAIRHPMLGHDDFSMLIGNDVSEHTTVIKMEATVDELIDAVSSSMITLEERSPSAIGAYHLVHCGGRKVGIGDRLPEVEKHIQSVAGDTPFIVTFTFGEYGYEKDGLNTCGGLMLSFTSFEE